MPSSTESVLYRIKLFFQVQLKKAKQMLIRLRELFLGRTARQNKKDKTSYIGKKMMPLFLFFTVYTFIIFSLMNRTFQAVPVIETIFNFLCGNEPYIFGIGLSLTFITIGFLLCNETIQNWVFSSLYWIKQFGLLAALLTANFFFARYLASTDLNIYAILLLFAMIWLIMQSIRIYWAARSTATKVEVRFSAYYSPFRYFIARIFPMVILGVLLFLSWLFRYGIVILTLDYIGKYAADMAFILYNHQMSGIIPTLYVGLLITTIFMVTQRILSQKRGSTKRAGVYDTLTFAIICFIMFLYSLYNIALYLFVDPTFLESINQVFGGTEESSSHSGIFFFIEFLITLIFLVWIILDLNKRFQKGFLFFTQEGFAIFLLGTVLAQTTARLGLVSGIANVDTLFAQFIKYDYIVLPWLILLFLGITIILYWLKPQETSMFMHANEDAIDKTQQTMESILSFFKREFIRRGERFPISDPMIKSLQNITDLPVGVIWSLIYRLDKKYIDVALEVIEDKNDEEKTVIFDFIPITERYQKSEIADKRAKKYLQDQFFENISRKQRKNINLQGQSSSSSQSDSFIQALSVQYGKKVKDEAYYLQTHKDQQVIIEKAITSETKTLVYNVIKNEFLKRAQQISDYPEDFYFRISDIAAKIEDVAKVPVGKVFQLVHQMAADNWNLNLSAKILDKNHPDDKNIEFLPIDDFEVYDVLAEFRPDLLKEIHILMQLWFEKAMFFKRTKLQQLPPLKYDDPDKEFERSYLSEWFASTMHFFSKNFTNYQKNRDLHPKYYKLKRAISQITQSKIGKNEK